METTDIVRRPLSQFVPRIHEPTLDLQSRRCHL